MSSWVVSALLILFAMGGEGQEHGPVFLMEPPARLVFANSTGAQVSCAAHGFPPPQLAWQMPDGAPLDDVPGLRQVLDNGTLVLLPFPATRYRQDVHAAVYRCRAHNAHGAVVSRDMRAQAAGSTLLVDEGWKLVVRSVRAEDARAQFSCSVLDSLTGERRRSAPVSIDIAPSTGAAAPRAVYHGQWETSVRRGGDVVLPCLVHANPPATITWYRESAGGVLRELRDGEAGGRYTRARRAGRAPRRRPRWRPVGVSRGQCARAHHAAAAAQRARTPHDARAATHAGGEQWWHCHHQLLMERLAFAEARMAPQRCSTRGWRVGRSC
ncbi:Down syndrome cell adhesion molecule-like protein Dscam2 [Leguminivora glycinivorella]|uniref:Down syndrome cell adhesion molecule-like protein Dscam2 n=1 Tax=Leguminivora glycinivorella TaxID=1035111 RepID=UPI0020105AC8|nr:Down syndrome cell adhesion molecule-like protein Dscam2 [Leguminivora glycinivorella]